MNTLPDTTRHSHPHPRGRYMTKLACAVLLLGVLNSQSVASSIPWKTSQFELSVDSKDLKDVLRNMGASQNVATWISPQVVGSVSGRFSMSPQRFLETMAASFGIMWYFDGNILYVYGANESKNANFAMNYATPDALRRTLNNLHITDSRYPLRVDPATRFIAVSGPPRYVEQVIEVAQTIDKGSKTKNGSEVRVFPLRYAWAADHKVQMDGNSTVIPGVARTLSEVYGRSKSQGGGMDMQKVTGNYAAPQAISPGADSGSSNTVTSPKPGSFAAWISNNSNSSSTAQMVKSPLPNGQMAGNNAPGRGEGGNSDEGGIDGPFIQADPRTNSIIIRDIPDRMDAYEELIKTLDVKPKVIEISATIIDIDTDALQELGINWATDSSSITTTANTGTSAISTVTTTTTALTGGGTFTALIGGAGKYLLTRLSALQQKSEARVIESPKVVTLDNVEALMNNKQTMYIQVSGYQAAQLYSIAAGVSLRVLPSVVQDNPGQPGKMKLTVNINDGQLTSQTVNSIPVVSNSEIDTQALIEEGQSLLIAGYSVRSDSKSSSGIPVLSNIPVIGNLFKYEQNEGKHQQRLFLLTPRLISQ